MRCDHKWHHPLKSSWDTSLWTDCLCLTGVLSRTSDRCPTGCSGRVNPEPRAWLWCRNAGGQRLMEQSGAGQSSPRILGGFGKQWSCHCRLILRGGRTGPSTQGANGSQLSHESACLPHSPLSLIPIDKPRRLREGGEDGGKEEDRRRGKQKVEKLRKRGTNKRAIITSALEHLKHWKVKRKEGNI